MREHTQHTCSFGVRALFGHTCRLDTLRAHALRFWQLRKRVFDDDLRVQGVWRRRQFERLVEQAQSSWIDMAC